MDCHIKEEETISSTSGEKTGEAAAIPTPFNKCELANTAPRQEPHVFVCVCEYVQL